MSARVLGEVLHGQRAHVPAARILTRSAQSSGASVVSMSVRGAFFHDSCNVSRAFGTHAMFAPRPACAVALALSSLQTLSPSEPARQGRVGRRLRIGEL